MRMQNEFQTVLQWPVYERVRYVEESPPTEKGNPGLPGGVLVPEGDIQRTYDPVLEEPELCLRFADLDPQDMEQLQKFAQQYGRLGLRSFWPHFALPRGGGEYVMHWKQEIVRMRTIYEVQGAILDGDAKWLSRKFQAHPRGPGLVMLLYDKTISPSRYDELVFVDPKAIEYGLVDLHIEDSELVKTGWGWEGLGDLGEPLKTARAFIADVISERLYKHVNPILEVSDEELVATFNVPSLVGAMYAQTWMQVASGEIETVKRCAYWCCRRWFIPNRTNQHYCDKRCYSRAKAWRHRQRQRKAVSSQIAS